MENIKKLIAYLDDTRSEGYPSKRYGGGNPYSYCTDCEASQIDISTKGHRGDCEWDSLQQLIDAAKKELK